MTELALRRQPDAPVPTPVAARFLAWLERRAAGEPLEHLSGRCHFWGRDLAVSPAVLVPRPETEFVVAAALALALPEEAAVVDVGTGSGAIAVTLAAERPRWRVTAVDRSGAALAVARANARALEVAVTFVRADLAGALGGGFHLVAANLPYIPTAALADLPLEVGHDPRVALDGGDDGLDLVRRLVADLSRLLVPGGWAVLELGEDQADQVATLAAAAGLGLHRRVRDVGGCDRVVVLARDAVQSQR